ncbi:hypothetical protein LCGC14_3101780 [marine sediment metagenome]|uniref:Uncharacterized protein n=1 Tax=marine sediment metagenome TaxID=412755 RepID=A0A0F8W7H6_9ZZZZ
MVNQLRLMEMVNKRFKEQLGYLANPRDYPEAMESIIETCTDMLEEEANDHNYEEASDDDNDS